MLFFVGILAVLWFGHDRLLNQTAPSFSLPGTYGGRVTLSSYRGQPVLLVFWTTSCGICRAELPIVNRLAPEFRDRGIAVVSIHLGSRDDAREYMRENHFAMTALADEDGIVGRDYGVYGVPKNVLVGANGKILRTHAGMLNERGLRSWMNTRS